MIGLAAIFPWWDSTWFSTLLVFVGVVLAVLVAVWVYSRQSSASKRQMREASFDHLRGVAAALIEWHDNFFMTSYADKDANARADLDANLIEQGRYMQNYVVATTPVASLTEITRGTWSFDERTVRAANVALSRMTIFNQLVQKQTDFLVQHAVNIEFLSVEDRKPIAAAAKRISMDLHGAIGNNAWYVDLKWAIARNMRDLGARLPARVGQSYCHWCFRTLTDPDREMSRSSRFVPVGSWACIKCIDGKKIGDPPGGWEGSWPPLGT